LKAASYKVKELKARLPTFHTPVEMLENRPRLAVMASMFVFATVKVLALRYSTIEDSII
jgi:hypothetical protein